MSASGYQQLPRYLIQFSMLTKGMSCSDDVAAILIAIEKAIRVPTPRTTLNRALTRLHRYRRTGMRRRCVGDVVGDAVVELLEDALDVGAGADQSG